MKFQPIRIAVLVMGLIVLITFGNVLARYFTSQSFAATEEFSIALLIVLSFLGSSAAFAFDRHIRVDFFVRKLPPGLRAFADWLSFAVTASLFAFIAAQWSFDWSNGDGITVDYIGNDSLTPYFRSAGLYLGADWNESRAGTCAVGTCIASAFAATHEVGTRQGAQGSRRRRKGSRRIR